MALKKLCLFYYLLLLTAIASAQQYPLQHYGTKEGLPHLTVYRTLQDKKGFLWFCTDFGLSKFDGKTFKNYSYKDGLSYNVVISVTEDNSGRMLIGTYQRGVDILTDTTIKKLTVAKGNIPNSVLAAMKRGSNIWIVGFEHDGTITLVKNNEARIIPLVNSLGDTVKVHKMCLIDSDIVFTTSNGVYKVANDTLVVPFKLMGTDVLEIRKELKGGLWATTKDDILLLNGDTISQSYKLPAVGTLSNMLVSRNNDLWIVQNPGVLSVIQSGKLIDIRRKITLPNVFLNDLQEDNEGNIWIATQGAGVFRLNSLDIYKYTADNDNINSYCTAIIPVDGKKLLLSSFGKLSILDQADLQKIPSSLAPTEYVYFIRRIRDKVYLGTPRGLSYKNTTYPYNEHHITRKRFGAISICAHDTGGIVAGTYDNLFKLVGDSLIPFDSTGYLMGKRCNALLYSGDTLWILTADGTVTFYRNIFTPECLPSQAHSFIAASMVKDANNRLWFASKDGLICRNNGSYRLYTTEDGMADNFCKALYLDSCNNLWVSSGNNRVNIVDLTTLSIRELIVDAEIPEILCFYRRGDQLLIGTIEGLSVVSISHVFEKETIPPLYITYAKTQTTSTTFPTKLDLPYYDNKLHIEYIGLNYRHSENVEYRYKIQNADDNWHITKNNSLELSALPGGHHDLLLSCRLKNGVWGKEAILHINIGIPFWKQWWWTTSLIVLTAITIFWTTRKIVLISEAKKNEKRLILHKMSYLKQQALSALINPHFIFNCMNSIQHFLNKNNTESANIYLSDFATLIRMTMEDAQEAFIDLEEEIKRIKLYLSLEKLRFGSKLQYELIIDNKLDVHSIRIPNMILQPYVENAILHGILPKKGDGKVTLYFTALENAIMQIRVEDNGVGINTPQEKEAPAKHHSFGMKLTADRLALLSRMTGLVFKVDVMQTHNESGGVTGTRVALTLPVDLSGKEISLIENELSK